jgi:hypothetical protein
MWAICVVSTMEKVEESTDNKAGGDASSIK